jgi:hypothetical protein
VVLKRYQYNYLRDLRPTVPTAENIVKFIYQSHNIFPYNLTYPCINYISVKRQTLFMDKGKYFWSFVPQIFHSGQHIRGSDRKSFKVMTSA